MDPFLDRCREAYELVVKHGAIFTAARAAGIPEATLRKRYHRHMRENGLPDVSPSSGQHAGAAARYAAPPEERQPARDPAQVKAAVHQAVMRGRTTLASLTEKARADMGEVLDAIDALRDEGFLINRVGDTYEIAPPAVASSTDRDGVIEIVSRPDNTFLFGACGDLHAASKYTRWDVREDLFRKYEEAGVQAVFDTGNWIDGEARFNRHDLEVAGLHQQISLLAERHPKTALPIYAVTGDDHEGWYAQREGIDIGGYCERLMREAGIDWTDLGYMEANVRLVNANTGKVARLAIVHPGGGSSYALSYAIQKIVESYEGGEKPAVAFYGHYHKIWSGIIRNVWVVQTGCGQDQTPFMRKKRLEAHVGGALVGLTQDPETGAITSMRPELIRYFNAGYYEGSGRWSHHAPARMMPRGVDAIRA